MKMAEKVATARYDHIVVGAGIEGSGTALALARAGKRTLLVEQHELGHGYGSSHGKSRIIRRSYCEDYFAKLMPDAYAAWEKIESETGNSIFIKAGLVSVAVPPSKHFDDLEQTMVQNGFPHEVIDGVELSKRYPAMKYGPEYKALYDPDAGVLKANVGLSSVQELFRRNGGTVKDRCKVTDIQASDSDVTVITEKETLVATSVVLCLGPWAPYFLPKLGINLPLEAIRVGVFYWKEKQTVEPGSHTSQHVPTFMDFNTNPEELYGLPSLEYPGRMKVAYHYGKPVSPDDMKYQADHTEPKRIISDYIKQHFPGLESTCDDALTHTCYYTTTPDLAFVLDKHPKHSNIVIGAGFCGTGFKLGPVVGEILSSLAQGKELKHDISAFSIQRFQK